MSIRIYAFFSFALAVTVASCAAPNATPNADVSLTRRATGPIRVPENKIGGVVNTGVFTVHAGKKVVVESDLFVFATKSVNIEGVLEVPARFKIAFFTPSFEISSGGSIEGAASYVDNPRTEVVSACSVYLADGAAWNVSPGASLEITASAKPQGTDKCRIAVVNGAHVTFDTAASGGSLADEPDGLPGGAMEIGTRVAVEDANALAKQHGHGALRAHTPDVLSLETPLKAGNGGSGKADPRGSKSLGAYSFHAYDGGDGGDVNVEVGEVVGTNAQLFGGDGGNGGTIAEKIGYANNPMDGTEAHQDALNVTLILGAGGYGGSISVVGRKFDGFKYAGGNVGNASLITSSTTNETFWSGDGYSPVVPLTFIAGTGSTVRLKLALPGRAGQGGDDKLVHSGTFYPVTIGGGRGGTPQKSTAQTPPPGTEAHGGPGGDLYIQRPLDTSRDSLVDRYGLRVSIGGFGSGGDSLEVGTSTSICPSPPPAGFAGGSAGHYYDDGLMPLMFPGLKNYGFGFYGGAGSYGKPPGNGAPAGTDDEHDTLGIPGLTGTAC